MTFAYYITDFCTIRICLAARVHALSVVRPLFYGWRTIGGCTTSELHPRRGAVIYRQRHRVAFDARCVGGATRGPAMPRTAAQYFVGIDVDQSWSV